MSLITESCMNITLNFIYSAAAQCAAMRFPASACEWLMLPYNVNPHQSEPILA